VTRKRLILTGDVNLMGVTDPSVPFARIGDVLGSADLIFSNLECCLYAPPGGHSVDNEGFFADPVVGGQVLTRSKVAAVGLANNVNYGEAAITASVARLDALGIAHTGAGANRAAARAPAVAACGDIRVSFLQRSSVYWRTNHEAADHATGIAVLRANTAYQVPEERPLPGYVPMNRPGLPPVVLTWADPKSLNGLRADIAEARAQSDLVVVSCHWGLWKDVLGYMTEIAHAAIDAGADMVIGHGPHHFLPVELYRGKPILYGLGSFSFHTGHRGKKHGDWIGLMALLDISGSTPARVGLRFVRHNDANETVLCPAADEAVAAAELSEASAKLGASFTEQDGALWLALL